MWDIARGRKFYLEYHKYPLLFNIFLRDLFWRLLGVKVDKKLSFKEHLNGIIKKASRQLSAISRIFPFMVSWS